MKRFLPLLLCVCLLAGCTPASPPVSPSSTPADPVSSPGSVPGQSGVSPQKIRVLATTYPVFLLTSALIDGVDGVELDLLVNSQTSCLHDYTLTVNDMKRIDKADIVVMNGVGLEDFMSDALAQTRAEVIDSSENIALLELFDENDHVHSHDHSHHDHDSHIWMSQENARLMLQNIAAGLAELDGSHAAAYEANLEAVLSQLPGETLAAQGLSCPYLITFHDGFQYFAQANGLTLLKAIEEESGSEASAAEIREIIALIEEYHIPAIFTEKNGSDATARAIARETGCKVYELDMMMSGESLGIAGYLEVMNQNYSTIAEALK